MAHATLLYTAAQMLLLALIFGLLLLLLLLLFNDVPQAMAALQGQSWCQDTITSALSALRGDVAVPPTAPGGRGEYRNSLSASFLFKFFVHVRIFVELPSNNLLRPSS